MRITAYIDGLCEPTIGIACYGYIVYADKDMLFSGRGIVGEGAGMSNNVAEYSALIKVLEELVGKNLQNEEIVICSDSRLLVNQMSGLWSIQGGYYLPYYERAKELVRKFPNIMFVWIPREKNIEADRLCKVACEEYYRIKMLNKLEGIT